MSRFRSMLIRHLGVFSVLLSCSSFSIAQEAANVQTFALSDGKDLVLLDVKADAVEYKGRKAVRIATEKGAFALLRGTDFRMEPSRRRSP